MVRPPSFKKSWFKNIPFTRLLYLYIYKKPYWKTTYMVVSIHGATPQIIQILGGYALTKTNHFRVPPIWKPPYVNFATLGAAGPVP